MYRLSCLLLLLCLAAQPAFAGRIERACLTSDRAAGQRLLCTCIQHAADRTLTRRDQRLAATFFEDPDRAQTIRRSTRRWHEQFWDRYEAFSRAAVRVCGR